jgi:hypothetical protein
MTSFTLMPFNNVSAEVNDICISLFNTPYLKSELELYAIDIYSSLFKKYKGSKVPFHIFDEAMKAFASILFIHRKIGKLIFDVPYLMLVADVSNGAAQIAIDTYIELSTTNCI